jgi:hypothetical protein
VVEVEIDGAIELEAARHGAITPAPRAAGNFRYIRAVKLARRWARAAAGGLAALALGCGAPAVGGAGPAPRAAVIRAIGPADYPRAAGERDVALVLGTEADGRSTAVPLAAAPGPVAIDVAIAGGDGAAAVVRAVDVAMARAPAAARAVAGAATGAPAPAMAWAAGASPAATVAAQTLGLDDVRVGGDGGGAAAGSAAVAAGYLASLLGAGVDRDAIVIGAIATDGGVDPIAGTGDALEAAIAAGKRRIGVAAAAAEARDPAWAARGPTVVPVADVEDALAVLTGAGLPRPRPADDGALALDPATAAAVAARYEAWHARVATLWPRLLTAQASGRLPAALAEAATRAERSIDRAGRARRGGDPLGAYQLVVRGWIDASIATIGAQVIDRALAADAAGARAPLDELAAAAPLADEAGLLTDALAAIDAAATASPTRRGRPAIDALAPAVTPAVRALVRRAAAAQRASDLLAIAGDAGAPDDAAPAAPAALALLLEQAERRARQHATAARIATGTIAPAIRLHYQAARALAGAPDVGDDDRRAALGHLRAASRLALEALATARHRR